MGGSQPAPAPHSAMSATPLDPAQLQAEAQALEADEAWDALLRLVQQQRPWHAEDERLSGYLDYLAGRALLEQQQLDQAIPLLRNSAAALPEVPFTHNLLGRALAGQQQWLSAATAQQRCLSLKPDFGYAWLELGRAREALADREGAEEAYRQALPLLPAAAHPCRAARRRRTERPGRGLAPPRRRFAGVPVATQ